MDRGPDDQVRGGARRFRRHGLLSFHPTPPLCNNVLLGIVGRVRTPPEGPADRRLDRTDVLGREVQA